jgi:peptidoglycan hydrolase FlgJ
MSETSPLLSPVSIAPATPTVASNPTLSGAKKAGEDFEAFFLSQSFENMFAGIEADPLFGGGNGESVYRSLLVQEYSKVAARSSSTGIGAQVTREILRLQEAQGAR